MQLGEVVTTHLSALIFQVRFRSTKSHYYVYSVFFFMQFESRPVHKEIGFNLKSGPEVETLFSIREDGNIYRPSYSHLQEFVFKIFLEHSSFLR